MNIDLSGLKDIHVPAEPPVWPLAWGWWLIVWAIFVGLIVVFYGLFCYLTSPKAYALRELKRINDLKGKTYLKEVNALLRRAVIYKYGPTIGATLYGEDWVAFLNQTKDVHFSKEYVELLEKSMYASKEILTQEEKKSI